MTERTADDALAARIAAMPAGLGEIHFWLGQELSWLHIHWAEFKTLFATDERRVALLNATAPQFFAHFETSSWHLILLHLCRLTDPPKSVGRSNLTVQRLPGLVDDAVAQAECASLVDEGVSRTEFARDWRNRRLAHSDLQRALDRAAHPLLPASRQHVEDALDCLRRLLNKIELRYENSTTSYEHAIPAPGGADRLLYFLSSGLEAEERRRSDRGWRPKHY